jgi:predicted NAD-dependent protein-ADP-ribosyltransferase YbiA (DUF1768 family)
MDLPGYLGNWILLYAKLRMLQFVFDFLDKYLIYKYWVIGQMDTDSIYLSISKQLLIQAVKNELKKQFQNMLTGHCNDDKCTHRFIPRECCGHHHWLDSRTPNIFKLEWEGYRLISLNSKTYAGVDSANQTIVSCKGVNAYLVKRNNPMALYEKVLSTKSSQSGVNRGLRIDNVGVKTYTQYREAFSYVYLKRILEEDGIHSKPLNVVLDPVPVKYFCIQTEAEVLGADYKMRFRTFETIFMTITQAFCYMALQNVHNMIFEQGLENVLCTNTNPKELMNQSNKNLSGTKWCGVRYNILKQIVENRNEQIPDLRAVLMRSEGRDIINGCDVDVWMGVKYDGAVLRWITDGHLTGQNKLGMIYMEIRNQMH